MTDEEMAEEYRKAKSECKAKITKVIEAWSAREETIHDVSFKDGAEYGYKKSNEWHYVKDGDLPINKNDGATYLLYTIYGEGGSPVVAYFAYRDKQELMNVWTGAILTEDKIIAWKEIVLPNESE